MIADAIGNALKSLGEIVLKVLAVIGLILLAVAAVVVAVALIAAIADMVPGDEVIVAAIESFIIGLMRALAGFAFA